MANQEVKNDERYVITTTRGLKFPEHPKHCKDVKAHHGRLIGITTMTKYLHEHFADMYPEVKAWLSHFESFNTNQSYGLALLRFCKTQDITPKEFGELWHSQDEILKARQIVSEYIETLTKPNLIRLTINSLKSFYRWYTKGFQLPLDTKKGGAAYVGIKQKRSTEKKRYAWGSLDDVRRKIQEVIGSARDLEDKTALMFLFQTGCRDGVLETLKMKHIREYQEIDGVKELVLTITGDIDIKISHYDFPMLDDSKEYGYYTFLANEGLELFERFLKQYHAEGNTEDYVFFKDFKGKRKSAVLGLNKRFKTAAMSCGFPKKEIWLHQLRSLFEQLGDNTLPRTQIEFLAGHLLKTAEKHYKWQNKTDSGKLYLKIDFGIPSPEKDLELEKKEKEIARLKEQNEKYEEAIKKAKATTTIEIQPLPQLKQPASPQATRDEINKAFNEFNETSLSEANNPFQVTQNPSAINEHKETMPPTPIKPKEIPEQPIPKPKIEYKFETTCPLKGTYVNKKECDNCTKTNSFMAFSDCYNAKQRFKKGIPTDQDKALFDFAIVNGEFQIEK